MAAVPAAKNTKARRRDGGHYKLARKLLKWIAL